MAFENGGASLRSTDGLVFDMTKMIGVDEDIQGLTNHHDVYPFIDPASHYSAQTFEGKVVLLTGASRGIGAEIARQYARAGATLSLVARNQELLDALKVSIEMETPGAQVSTFAADVADTAAAGGIVKETVEKYGQLDVVVANAGVARPPGYRIGAADPLQWWSTFEINLRGVFNFVHFALPHLQKTKGSVVGVTSTSGQARQFTYSDYSISKLALNRLMEFIPIEYSEVRSFAVHPGAVDMALLRSSGYEVVNTDSPSLSAATILHVTAGKADWLSGRYMSSTWDLEEVEREYKAKILEKNGLVAKLFVP